VLSAALGKIAKWSYQAAPFARRSPASPGARWNQRSAPACFKPHERPEGCVFAESGHQTAGRI